jgi:DNA repair protein RAD16
LLALTCCYGPPARDIDSNLDIKAKLRRDHGKSEQPADLKLHLLPFQLEGVAWLVHQETTEFKGGILAG